MRECNIFKERTSQQQGVDWGGGAKFRLSRRAILYIGNGCHSSSDGRDDDAKSAPSSFCCYWRRVAICIIMIIIIFMCALNSIGIVPYYTLLKKKVLLSTFDSLDLNFEGSRKELMTKSNVSLRVLRCRKWKREPLHISLYAHYLNFRWYFGDETTKTRRRVGLSISVGRFLSLIKI